MADNIIITPGVGATVATDDVSAVQYQVVKIGLGLNGVFREYLDYGQNIMASGIPVSIASNQSAIPISTVKPDGTNTMPSLDAAARPGFFKITDGTLTCGLVHETGASAVDAQAIGGGTPHGSVNAGNPILNGAEAIAHGVNPTAVAAGNRSKLYSNRAGVPFVMGGHPNVVTLEFAASGTTTDVSMMSVNTGSKIVVTQIQAMAAQANTTFPQIRVGFGATTTPTGSGVLLTHPGLPSGGNISRGDGSGILGVGADGEDLRITCAAAATAMVRVLTSFYTIES